MRKTLILLALTLSPFLQPQQAFACSCFYYENADERFQAYFDNADLVIQGKVEAVAEEDTKMYSISVEKVWKGQADAYVNILTATDSAMCGVELSTNESYIIFASKSDDGMEHTGLCSGTVHAAEAGDLAKWLNEYDGGGVVSENPPSVDCSPYRCANGEVIPACTEDGHVINYLVAPCEFKGGEVAVSENPPSVSTDFSDVGETHPNYTAVNYVKNEGIVQGYGDGSYKPGQYINRAEFTKIVTVAVYGEELIQRENKPGFYKDTHGFPDVPEDAWHAPYILFAWQHYIIGGNPDGTFRPANNVNFAEASKIVVEAFGIETSPEDQTDVWWKPYVYALSRVGGLPSSFTDPNQLVTRGEMAEIIYRVKTGIGSDL